jgi:tripartite ATP-independent transporter DctM subunit
LGTALVAIYYKKLNWTVIKKSFLNSVDLTVMLLMIVAGAIAFSQVLAYSGATTSLSKLVVDANLAPILIVIITQLILLFLGMFMSVVAMIMICAPIFFPVIVAFGFDPVWFGVIFLINLEIANITPPFGVNLFVMKSVSGYTLEDCFKAAAPYVFLHILGMFLIIFFPSIALWLPDMLMIR